MSRTEGRPTLERRLLQYLACPRCGADLTPPAERAAGLDCSAGCGTYPVRGGVPRLLPELAAQEPAAAEEHQRDTGAAFGTQWSLYRYGDTTWGVTVEERLEVALHELGWSESDVKGKVILDAGCGNGTLSAALASLGAEVVGIDLSPSVFRADRHYSRRRLHFVQGNLFFPPVKRGAYDAIYSCGVFHHTPDTRRCFDALVPALRPDSEARLFVWLYAPRSKLFDLTVEPLMKVTRRLPPWLLVPICFTLSPIVEGASRALTAVGLLDYAPRTSRDRAIQLHDLLSPPFVWYHTYDEVRGWAREAGFREISRTPYRPTGGDRERADMLRKYRRVCRPGFGMLCRERAPSEEMAMA